MLAWTHYQDTLCSCGNPLEESTDPVNAGKYHAPPPRRCFACTELFATVEPYAEKSSHPRALKFSVGLREVDRGR